MAGADQRDRTPLPQDQQERRTANVPTGDNAADPPFAAVVFAQRPRIEAALIEVTIMRRFAGNELINDRITDEITILTFRHLLEKHWMGEHIFENMKAHLSARGMPMRQGMIVDGTLIADPSLLKKKDGKHDPEIHPDHEGQPVVFRCEGALWW